MLTRTKAAQYLAESVIANNNRQKAIDNVAKWLKKTGKTRDAKYLANDVSAILLNNGYLYATVSTARPITENTKSYINEYLSKTYNVSKIEIKYILDDKLIGGVKIETPIGTLDKSVKAQISKIVEGVS